MLMWKGFEFEQIFLVVVIMYFICNVVMFGNWMVSGCLDQFFRLKIGFIESGMGWVFFVVEVLEY